MPGVHCEGCLASIAGILAEVAGATLVDGDPESKRITVAYDDHVVSLSTVEGALSAGGFPVDEPARPLRFLLGAVMVAAVLAVAGHLAGYQGYVYGLAVPRAFNRLAPPVVGVVAGAAAFFSPCVFPLLPGYVSWFLLGSAPSEVDGRRAELARSLRLGAVAAAGVMAVDVVVFAVIATVGAASPFTADVRKEGWALLAVRFCAGAVIAAMGVRALYGRGGWGGIPVRLGKAAGARAAGATGTRGMFVYGLTYNAAGIACTGPILLGLMLFYALISRQALAAFVAFTLTMGILMVGVTVLVGLARSGLVARLRRSTQSVQRVGGAVLVAVGVYTMAIHSFPWGRELFVRVFLRHVLS